MDNCKHVSKILPAMDNTLLNPQKWICNVCGTTESVWACLTCCNVACGRFIKEHAFLHYQQTDHPLVLEVNDGYAFCYACDDYILNDNASGDLRLLREIVSVVARQRFDPRDTSSDVGTRALRPRGDDGGVLAGAGSSMGSDQMQNIVLKFRRLSTMNRAFSAWRDYVDAKKRPTRALSKRVPSTTAPSKSAATGSPTVAPAATAVKDSAMKRPLSPANTPPATKRPRVASRTTPAAAADDDDEERPFTPGVTGLRNLGNTCYMNSVLQVLSNLDDFREHFLAYCPIKPVVELTDYERGITPEYARQTTTECLRRVTEPRSRRLRSSSESDLTAIVATDSERVDGTTDTTADASQLGSKTSNNSGSSSLTEEVYALLRVMWSGKMSIVIPHGFLHAVWDRVPTFKGYQQQDAQEFLCEMLEKLTDELLSQEEHDRPESLKKSPRLTSNTSAGRTPLRHLSRSASTVDTKALDFADGQQSERASVVQNLIRWLFNGTLQSQVTCLRCGTSSDKVDMFSDLSLEFPERFQDNRLTCSNLAVDACSVEEMLAAFTAEEQLGMVYACERCSGATRAATTGNTAIRTEAKKRIQLRQLPKILRLHLKRFRWSGRNNRDKINYHVRFQEFIDVAPYCVANKTAGPHDSGSTLYRLCGVINHHGRGFNSGHYTSYCWNSSGQFWMHCNDARLELSSLDEVLASQAYILFYSRAEQSTAGTPTSGRARVEPNADTPTSGRARVEPSLGSSSSGYDSSVDPNATPKRKQRRMTSSVDEGVTSSASEDDADRTDVESRRLTRSAKRE